MNLRKMYWAARPRSHDPAADPMLRTRALRGILPLGWLRKHFNDIPGVLALMVPFEHARPAWAVEEVCETV
jgi:hypothetical protein